MSICSPGPALCVLRALLELIFVFSGCWQLLVQPVDCFLSCLESCGPALQTPPHCPLSLSGVLGRDLGPDPNRSMAVSFPVPSLNGRRSPGTLKEMQGVSLVLPLLPCICARTPRENVPVACGHSFFLFGVSIISHLHSWGLMLRQL